MGTRIDLPRQHRTLSTLTDLWKVLFTVVLLLESWLGHGCADMIWWWYFAQFPQKMHGSSWACSPQQFQELRLGDYAYYGQISSGWNRPPSRMPWYHLGYWRSLGELETTSFNCNLNLNPSRTATRSLTSNHSNPNPEHISLLLQTLPSFEKQRLRPKSDFSGLDLRLGPPLQRPGRRGDPWISLGDETSVFRMDRWINFSNFTIFGFFGRFLDRSRACSSISSCHLNLSRKNRVHSNIWQAFFGWFHIFLFPIPTGKSWSSRFFSCPDLTGGFRVQWHVATLSSGPDTLIS